MAATALLKKPPATQIASLSVLGWFWSLMMTSLCGGASGAGDTQGMAWRVEATT